MQSSERELQNSTSFKFWMLLLNGFPLFHLVIIVLVVLYANSLLVGLFWAVIILYLLPPFCARCILSLYKISSEEIKTDSREFLVWWALSNFQVLFVRFGFLEEILRLVPGLYSGWLRLWGARIGRLTYWAPGTVILDRSFLQIGDDVVFGAGVRINPHVIKADDSGHDCLLLANITIGDRCLIGGYSLLTAGTKISDDEKTKAFFIAPPFTTWTHGKRVRERPGLEVKG